ncbi:helix-hairpin-helix domain-containing protein [Rhodanobacter sp. AS-Z3]|nr:helix-hairpin-helix domain-containing protein [Rhodanobacter sp. AS-Z3]WEN15458.1 helix-hairpin-helix domain-containing protein [Rhodanobacter sp. AS-Z3]
MNPAKVVRSRIRQFTDLPNIGPASARDFVLLGFSEPAQLIGADPLVMYHALCAATGSRQDPCVLDVFMSVTHFLSGGEAEPWWHFTAQRKRQYTALDNAAAEPKAAVRPRDGVGETYVETCPGVEIPSHAAQPAVGTTRVRDKR